MVDSLGELIQPTAEEGDLRMTETNPPKSAKKPRWTSLEIGLITIVSLLFIIIVALIILFATQKTGECRRTGHMLIRKKREISQASRNTFTFFVRVLTKAVIKKNVCLFL